MFKREKTEDEEMRDRVHEKFERIETITNIEALKLLVTAASYPGSEYHRYYQLTLNRLVTVVEEQTLFKSLRESLAPVFAHDDSRDKQWVEELQFILDNPELDARKGIQDTITFMTIDETIYDERNDK